MLRLDIRGVNAYPLEKEVLTEGRVGLEISFTFSSDWDGLTKIAVFEGAQTIDVILVNDRCVVPHEALAQSGSALRIGVYGQNTAGDIVIPTVWAKFGMVQPAAVPSEVSSKPPTPSVVAQILSAAQNAESSASEAERIAQSVRDDADAGEFDGKDGTDGVDGKDGSAIWQASAAPTHESPGGGKPDFDYYLDSSLTGPADKTPAVGDLVFYNSSYYPVTYHGTVGGIGTCVFVGTPVSIKGDTGSTGATGPQGPEGPAGQDGADGSDGATIWTSNSAPTTSGDDTYFATSGLNGPAGQTAKAGDAVLYSSYYYVISSVSGGNAYVGTPIDLSTKFWTNTQVGLLQQVFQHLKYDSASAGDIAAELITSLQGNAVWSQDQITLLDALLSHVKYTDAEGDTYADDLVDALCGNAISPITIPDLATATPVMDGAAAVGSSGKAAREDHVHPSDTTKQNKIAVSGILKGDGNGGVTAAVAGTDYLATAPVTSVNTKTGAVTLDASDVGAIAEPSGGSVGQVLKKTATGAEWANESGGGGGGAVDSVNGQTGAVVLGAGDVGAIAAPASPTVGDFLCWNGSAWAATSMSAWQGGNY